MQTKVKSTSGQNNSCFLINHGTAYPKAIILKFLHLIAIVYFNQN